MTAGDRRGREISGTDAFVELDAAGIGRFASLYAAAFNAPPWCDGWDEAGAVERLQGFAAFLSFQGLGWLGPAGPAGLMLGWGERWTTGWVFRLQEMCVHPTLQGRGLGTQWMSAFEERLRQRGFLGIHLQTGGAAPARAFYERSGFRPSDLVTLRKRLV